jgi:hypothetical protein
MPVLTSCGQLIGSHLHVTDKTLTRRIETWNGQSLCRCLQCVEDLCTQIPELLSTSSLSWKRGNLDLTNQRLSVTTAARPTLAVRSNKLDKLELDHNSCCCINIYFEVKSGWKLRSKGSDCWRLVRRELSIRIRTRICVYARILAFKKLIFYASQYLHNFVCNEAQS